MRHADVLSPLIISTSPHQKGGRNIPSIMREVALALSPAFLVAAYSFGWWALVVTLISAVSAMAAEAGWQYACGKKVNVSDGSALLSGLLLAAMLPPNVSWYVPVIGSAFAIIVVKQCFGGLGNNIWNPACAARAFLQAAMADQINSGSWVRLGEGGILSHASFRLGGAFDELAAKGIDAVSGATAKGADVVSGATMLAKMKAGTALTSYDIWHGAFGFEGGSLAETSAIAIAIGGIWLLARKIIQWEIPVCFIATAVLLGWLLPAPLRPEGGAVTWTGWCEGSPLAHLVGGGLMIGAFFMATDYVTSPMTRMGHVIFAVGCGVLTAVIRIYSTGYPEGVCYSILLMNTCVPLIDAWTKPARFGTGKQTEPKNA